MGAGLCRLDCRPTARAGSLYRLPALLYRWYCDHGNENMIHPTQAFYRPNESITIPIQGHFHATIWHLHEKIAEIEGKHQLIWTPPTIPKRGYAVHIQQEQ